MAENMQKIKLLKLYELLRKETDIDHPISRVELCRRLNEMGISSNVRTLSKDIDVMQNNGFEIMSFLKDKEKFYYVPEHELTIPEIKILIDAVQAASFVTDKKTAEIVEKVAALGGSHQAELLKENMVCFNTRKHTNESILYTVDGIEDAIIRKKKIAFNYFHLNEKAERVYVTTGTGDKKRYDRFIVDDFDGYFVARAKALMKVIETAMGKRIADKGSEQTINLYGVSLEDIEDPA